MPQEVKSRISSDVLSRALDLSPEAIYLINVQSHVEYANPAAAKMLGYHEDDLLGLSVPDLDPNASQSDFQRHLERVRAGEQVEFDTHHRNQNGTLIPVHIHSSYLEIAGEPFVYVIARDMSSQKLILHAYQETEQLFATLFEASPIGLVVIDPGLGFVRWNSMFRGMMGYSDAELLGMTGMNICHPDDQLMVANIVEWSGSGEDLAQTVIHRYRSKTGRDFWGRVTIRDVKDTLGKLRRFCFVEDIDEEYRANEKMKQANSQLQAISGSIYEALVTADEVGNIISWGGGAEAIFGYTEEEVIGKPPACLVPERHYQSHIDGMWSWSQGHNMALFSGLHEMYGRRKTGEEFPLEVAFSEWEGEGKRYLTGAVRDVSAHERWEKILRGIVDGTASQTGERFFESLVTHLASALDARYAFVTEALDQPPTQVRTLAFLERNEILENREFTVVGTPCEGVTVGQPCCYPRNVSSEFPQAVDLVSLGVESFLGAPLTSSHGEIMGYLVVMDDCPMTEDVSRLKNIIMVFAARAGAELERARSDQRIENLLKSNQSLLRRSIAVQEEERRRLRRELHDEMGQSLTGIQAYAATISGLSESDPNSPSHQAAESIRAITADVFGAMRRIMNQLRPALLDELGLHASLEAMVEDWMKQNSGVRTELKVDGGLSTFSESINITVYRLIQESLTNIARHAAATEVMISLQHEIDPHGDRLVLKVSDNGKGMSDRRGSGGMGLIGMSERVRAVGGALDIGSLDEGGTVIKICLPVDD